jgi:hypothetical protein
VPAGRSPRSSDAAEEDAEDREVEAMIARLLGEKT